MENSTIEFERKAYREILDWKAKLAAVFDDLYAKARELGGQVSGEHGIGSAKRPYLDASLSAETRAIMRGIKHVFDPKNILNPHKIVGD